MRPDPKEEMRRIIKERLGQITSENKRSRSEHIHRHLMDRPEFKNAHAILLYCALADEVSTLPILEEILARGKKLALPRCIPATLDLELKWITNLDEDLEPGVMNIAEPIAQLPSASLSDINLAIIPGRAFDLRGNRLGRGKGYYDRFLAHPDFQAVKGAIAFDLQLVNTVPTETSDRPVDFIVTETGVSICPHYTPRK